MIWSTVLGQCAIMSDKPPDYVALFLGWWYAAPCALSLLLLHGSLAFLRRSYASEIISCAVRYANT
jgi:hypothetical protein